MNPDRLLCERMYSIAHNTSDPYGELISNYIKGQFPNFLAKGDSAILELLTEAIIGTGQVRFGPRPAPEILVKLREVITFWMKQDAPIPFLVPWGSEKPDGSSVDVAELYALKMVECLQSRVKEFYIPGIRVNIRLEDASAPHLMFDRAEAARTEAARYTAAFVNLVKVSSLSHYIKPIPESSLTSEQLFNADADLVLPVMQAHLLDPNDKLKLRALVDMGFSGAITATTRQFYLDRYTRIYPGNTEEQNIYILARYFAGALSRKRLGITGTSKDWQGMNLELSFNPPVPGIPLEYQPRRVFYRTLPSSITNSHMPPWRAKGYFKIQGDTVKPALASFHDALEFNSNVLTLSDGTIKQDLQADYVVL